MVKSFLRSLVWFALASVSSPMLIGALVDTDGNAATNQTLLGDIDMGVGTLGDLKSYVEPSKISDGTNTIDAAGNVLKEGFAPWYIKSFEDTTYSPYIRMTFQTYYVSSEGYKTGWMSDIPYRDTYYIGIWEDLAVVEYYEKEGNVYSAIIGDPIVGATSTNITQVGGLECYIFRDSIYAKDYVGKLALTNDIPPAVAVVAPSTNATAGSAADAKATGTALYTGFTEWEFSGLLLPDGVTVSSMTFANGTWTLTLSDGDFFEMSGTSESDLKVEFMTEGVTATRHLITPTMTSQLTNDGPPATSPNAGHPFATTNQIPDVSGKLNGAATYPAWNPNDEYEPGDTVSHLGRLWRVPLSSGVTFSGYVYEPVNGAAASSWEEVFIYSLKQDRLPYPTNAIPYAAISGTPSLSGYATHSEVNAAAKDGTNYTDSIAQSIKRITDGINVINSDRTVTVANYTFGNWSYTRSDDNYDIDGLPEWVTSEEGLDWRTGWEGAGWYAYEGSSAYIISNNSNATNLVKDIEGTTFTFSREVTSVSTVSDMLSLESDLGGYLPVSQNGGISFNNSRLALIGGDEDILEPQLTIGGGHYVGGSLVVNDNYDSSGGITISGASEGASRGSIRVNGVDILETIDRAVETNSMQDTAISAKQDKLPYETNSIPYSVISGTPNLSLYQTKLPYPTNAIPYSSIAGTPSLSVYAMHTDVSNAATASTNYTDMAVSNKLDASSTYQQWSSSESYLRGAVVSYAGKLWEANAPLEPGDSPPSSDNVWWLPTTVDSQKQDKLTTAQVNNINSVPNKQDKLPYSTNSIPYSVISGAPDGMTTNVVKNIITNSVPSWSDWTYSGDIAAGVTYNIVSSQNGGGFSFRLYDFATDTLLATAASLEEHPETILFSVTGGTITATRTRAYYSDVAKVDGKVNAVSNWVENMDTSYFRTNVAVAASTTRVVCPSNQNQTVQYINAPAGVSTIEITLPKDGMTKDWLVYILATDEINIVLPPANYWATSETVTNKIEASTATALYFSQISDNIYSIGRQDNLVPITVLSTREILMQSIREKSKTKRRLVR